jgi:hypothetical protein
MDSTKKINITLTIKKVRNIDAEDDSNKLNTLINIEDLVDALSSKGNEADINDLLQLLNAYKQCNEIMADAFISVDRMDLFTEKVESNETIDFIINQIIKS